MNLSWLPGVFFSILAISLGIGACTAEDNTEYLVYLQGGVSSLANGTNGTMVLTIADAIPYYGMNVVNRTILMPMDATSPYVLPLNAALVLNGPDGESVYLVEITTWSFDNDKNILTFDITPLEFYEGKELTKFTDVKQDLGPDTVGKELSTGVYLEITGEVPGNAARPPIKRVCVYRDIGGNCLQYRIQ